MASHTTTPRTAGIPARSKSPSPSAPSAKSAVKKSPAAKPAEIRDDLERILLSELTPAERDHVALGIDKNFPLTVSFTPNGIVVYLWQDGRLCSKFDGTTTTVEKLWAECERLCPQDPANSVAADTSIQITHAGRIALAVEDTVSELLSTGKRLIIDDGTSRGWGDSALRRIITAHVTAHIPAPQFDLPPAAPGTTAARIIAKCAELAQFLLGKNKSYGDSALHPIRVFSRATAREGLCTRADDKLARLQNAPGAYGENDVKDLTGYLIFLLIQDDLDAEAKKGGSPQ